VHALPCIPLLLLQEVLEEKKAEFMDKLNTYMKRGAK
jgi:hypothetical protein